MVWDNINIDGVMLTNIQRFSLHDGPGIRTTIFLKGCVLKCPWCSNPENLSPCQEKYVRDGTEGIYGRVVSCEELYREVIKDMGFYAGADSSPDCQDFFVQNSDELDRLPGGVTFSGGEALLQATRLMPLLERLQREHIHIAVETCLFVGSRQMNLALQYIDLFYVDVKILDEKACREILQGDIGIYTANLEALFSWRDQNGRRKPVVFRVPVIGGFTDMDRNRKEIAALITRYMPIKVEIIKEHNLSISKYESLGLTAPDYKGVSDALMEAYKAELEKTGVPVEICRI